MKPSPTLELVAKNADKPVTDRERQDVSAIVSRVRTRMVERLPFFGHLLLKMTIVVTRMMPLAGVTRDRKLLINPDWALMTTEPELGATLVHEVLHCAMLVWERQAGRTVMAIGPDMHPVNLWNVSHDHTINWVIRDLSARVTGGSGEVLDPEKWDPPGLIDEKFKDMSAEEIYDILLKSLKPPPKGMQFKMQGGSAMLFYQDVDGSKDDVQDGAGGGSKDGKDEEGQGKGRPMTEQEKRAQDQFWKVAIIEAAQVHEQKQRGTLPAGIKKFIEEILDPRVPWQEVLSRWVGENGRRADFTWQRPSRRSESVGELLPSLRKHGVVDLVVLWDTSGSMGGREKEIFSEIIGIAEDLHLGIRVICCDCAIHSDQSDVESVEDVDVKGGGGSDFNPAFDLLVEEGYEGVVIAFTDGCIGVPETKPGAIKDTLWCIWPSERGDRDPTEGAWGDVLRVDEEGFATKTGKKTEEEAA